MIQKMCSNMAILLCLGAICLFPAKVNAQTSPKMFLDVSINGEIDTNPFLTDGGESSLAATLQIDPQINWENETSNVELNANLRISQYSRQFGNDVGGIMGLRSRKAFNDRTSLSTNVRLRSARFSLQDFVSGDRNIPMGSIGSPILKPTNLSVASRRTRVTSLTGYIGVDHTLNENTAINSYTSAAYSRFGASTENDYRTSAVGSQFRRILSERMSVIAGATVTVVDYIGIDNGDAQIFSPQVGLEGKLSERLNWTAALGASIASLKNESGVSSSKTYLNGSFALCRSGVSSSLCASVARGAEPTPFGGISAVTNVAVSYDQRITSKGRIALAGRFGQTNQTVTSGPLFDTNGLLGVSANYTHQHNDRTTLFASSTYAKAFTRQTTDATNYSFSIGVKIRIGRLG